MKNTKWLRSALLGGVAVSVMATGAQADELSDLKAQLEALQARVNTIETAPQANLPAGASLMTVKSGQGSLNSFGKAAAKDRLNTTDDRGFTVAITPAADLPAPVTEITVYGYVKLDVRFASETGNGGITHGMTAYHGANEANQWALTAKQSRFGIKSKTDTAIGQIRTKIEGDFYGAAGNDFRLRHAYGEWDMTPNWTLVAGQTWHNGSLLPIGISTIDFSGPAGQTYSRSPVLRLRYKSGPITARIGIGNPTTGGADYPNFGGSLMYTASGGHEFIVAAEIGDQDTAAAAASAAANTLAVAAQTNTSWAVGGGANLNLGDIATFTTGAYFGRGAVARRYLNQEGFSVVDAAGNPTTMWGFNAGVQISVSETTTVNAGFGYTDQKESATSSLCNQAVAARTSACVDDVMTIHANILWRPVKQMRFGWEVQWGRNDYYTAPTNTVVAGQFGAWFFF